MVMTRLDNRKNDSFIFHTIEELVPLDHQVRTLENAIDWNFIYPLVKPFYSDLGRPSIDPVVLFKMIFINFTFGIHSMRRTCREIEVNLAYRWFLGLSIEDKVLITNLNAKMFIKLNATKYSHNSILWQGLLFFKPFHC